VRRADALRLASLGFLTLFLELALIRYLAGSIWNLGYFPNLVLIAVFVGMGSGFLLHARVPEDRSPTLFLGAGVLVAALAVFVGIAHPALPGLGKFGGEIGGELFFTAAAKTGEGAANFVLFGVWFLAVAAIYALVSQRTAKLFRTFPPHTAYTLDIAGSTAGILAFMLASALHLPAWSWFLALAIPFGLAIPRYRLPALGLVVAAMVVWTQDRRLMAEPQYTGPLEVTWSPYQKLELSHAGTLGLIWANGVGHQVIYPNDELKKKPYEVPYLHRRDATPDLPPIGSALIIGAGNGNDVAVGLEHDVAAIDAVEIDPVIASIGRRLHPGAPFSDPRVTLTIDDGRAFMVRAPKRYDLVIFALTDSLVRASGMNQLRLENFLFTKESITRAWSLLSPHGELVLYNYYRAPWLGEKLTRMLRDVSGHEPELLFQDQDFLMIGVGPDRPPADPSKASSEKLDLPTDDWPFLYLEHRGIPGLYLGVMAAMLVLVGGGMALLRRRSAESGGALTAAFLLMGLAFLLLETKSVVQFSLLFGNTWLNNSLVFLAVLLMVLAANWAALPLRERSLPIAYAALLGSCLLSLAIPLSALLALAPAARFAAASLVTFSPIFFANLVFSLSFRDAKLPEVLFGWNLLGATLGGVVEYASMALGYRGLAWIVAATYLAVFLLVWRARPKIAFSGDRA
jgi:hypothetical protein